MKFCYQCGRFTPGEPLFCQSCGSTYDVKLCPRLHPNPRWADICSQCGSHDLSTPQPRIPLLWRVLAFVLRVLAVLLVGILSLLVVVEVLQAMLESSQLQGALLSLVILIALLWWMWTELPDWIRKLIRRLLKRKEGRNER